MLPKTPTLSADDLFRMRLEAMIDARHELVRLAKLIDWKRFEDAFGPLYEENRGRPALPTRLMAGLHLLKHIKALSDEQVCAQWVENPYFQAFCGEEFFRHELPLFDDALAQSDWAFETRGPLGRDDCRGNEDRGGLALRDGTRDDRHDGGDQGGGPSNR